MQSDIYWKPATQASVLWSTLHKEVPRPIKRSEIECEIVLSFMYMAAVIMKEWFYYANIFIEINTESLGICFVD